MEETFIHIIDLTSGCEFIHTTSKGLSIDSVKNLLSWLEDNRGPYYNIEINNSPMNK